MTLVCYVVLVSSEWLLTSLFIAGQSGIQDIHYCFIFVLLHAHFFTFIVEMIPAFGKNGTFVSNYI